jgi:hypothetical protein
MVLVLFVVTLVSQRIEQGPFIFAFNAKIFSLFTQRPKEPLRNPQGSNRNHPNWFLFNLGSIWFKNGSFLNYWKKVQIRSKGFFPVY